jgi:hypothetical protein
MNDQRPWWFKIIMVPLGVVFIILVTLHRIFFPSSAPSMSEQINIVSENPDINNQGSSPVKKETSSQNSPQEEPNPILLGLGAAAVSVDSAIDNTLSSSEATAIANLITYASFPTVIQALSALAKEWSKKHSSDSSIPQEGSPQPSGTDIIRITLRMTREDDHEFTEWLTDPKRLKEYIDAFNRPSSWIKPVYVTFVKRNRKKIKVYVTKGTQNNIELDTMLSYLHIDPE